MSNETVVVPRDADETMMEAAVNAANRHDFAVDGLIGRVQMRAAYDAFLASAPQPAGDDLRERVEGVDCPVIKALKVWAASGQADDAPIYSDRHDEALSAIEIDGGVTNISDPDYSVGDVRRFLAALQAPGEAEIETINPQFWAWLEARGIAPDGDAGVIDWNDIISALDDHENEITHPPADRGGEWRPIETAPEKTEVLVCVTHNLGSDEWETNQWVDFRIEDRWVHYPDRIDIPFPPTHWQPLPEPPARPATEGGEG